MLHHKSDNSIKVTDAQSTKQRSPRFLRAKNLFFLRLELFKAKRN